MEGASGNGRAVADALFQPETTRTVRVLMKTKSPHSRSGGRILRQKLTEKEGNRAQEPARPIARKAASGHIKPWPDGHEPPAEHRFSLNDFPPEHDVSPDPCASHGGASRSQERRERDGRWPVCNLFFPVRSGHTTRLVT